jgi:hypothetical protein
MSNVTKKDHDEQRRLTEKLQKLQREMLDFDARNDILLARAYDNAQTAEDRMVEHVERYGETDLFVALRERPELFGEYPSDKARFDDAYEARKQLPLNFAEYKKRRDEADIAQRTLNTIKQEREQQDPHRDDDPFPKR